MLTVVLLIGSNLFMTLGWYGHLKYRSTVLWKVILISWLIALPEYCLQVSGNGFGFGKFSAYQLKILQEVITLSVFVGFAYFYLGEFLRWNYVVSFLFILGAVVFGFWGGRN